MELNMMMMMMTPTSMNRIASTQPPPPTRAGSNSSRTGAAAGLPSSISCQVESSANISTHDPEDHNHFHHSEEEESFPSAEAFSTKGPTFRPTTTTNTTTATTDKLELGGIDFGLMGLESSLEDQQELDDDEDQCNDEAGSSVDSRSARTPTPGVYGGAGNTSGSTGIAGIMGTTATSSSLPFHPYYHASYSPTTTTTTTTTNIDQDTSYPASPLSIHETGFNLGGSMMFDDYDSFGLQQALSRAITRHISAATQHDHSRASNFLETNNNQQQHNNKSLGPITLVESKSCSLPDSSTVNTPIGCHPFPSQFFPDDRSNHHHHNHNHHHHNKSSTTKSHGHTGFDARAIDGFLRSGGGVDDENDEEEKAAAATNAAAGGSSPRSDPYTSAKSRTTPPTRFMVVTYPQVQEEDGDDLDNERHHCHQNPRNNNQNRQQHSMSSNNNNNNNNNLFTPKYPPFLRNPPGQGQQHGFSSNGGNPGRNNNYRTLPHTYRQHLDTTPRRDEPPRVVWEHDSSTLIPPLGGSMNTAATTTTTTTTNTATKSSSAISRKRPLKSLIQQNQLQPPVFVVFEDLASQIDIRASGGMTTNGTTKVKCAVTSFGQPVWVRSVSDFLQSGVLFGVYKRLEYCPQSERLAFFDHIFTNITPANSAAFCGRSGIAAVNNNVNSPISPANGSTTAGTVDDIVSSLAMDAIGVEILHNALQAGDQLHRTIVVTRLARNALLLSLHCNGCWSIQDALELGGVSERLRLALALRNHFIRCVEDQNGNHVIQRCIEYLPGPDLQYFIDVLKGQASRLAVHCFGCRVIQRLLEHPQVTQSQVKDIVDELMQDVLFLAQNQYGNYVVQHLFVYGGGTIRETIVQNICDNIDAFATQKFSSNVVERCLSLEEPADLRNRICRSVLNTLPMDPGSSGGGRAKGGEPILFSLLRDKFANYMIQKALEASTGDTQEALLNAIGLRLTELKNYKYGKHILAAYMRATHQRHRVNSTSSAQHKGSPTTMATSPSRTPTYNNKSNDEGNNNNNNWQWCHSSSTATTASSRTKYSPQPQQQNRYCSPELIGDNDIGASYNHHNNHQHLNKCSDFDSAPWSFRPSSAKNRLSS